MLGSLFMASAAPVAAQIITLRPERTTGGLHVRLGSTGRDDTVLGIGAELATPAGFFAGRLVGVLETTALFPSDVPVEENHEMGLLYGWQIGWGEDPETIARNGGSLSYYVTLAAAAGLARTTFIRRGAFVQAQSGYFHSYDKYERLVEQDLGRVYEVRLMIGSDVAGISVGVFGNVNRVEDFRGYYFGFFYGHRD